MQIFPIFFIDLKDPYFKVERVTENVRFVIMTRIIHGQIDLSTPFDPMGQTFKVNMELSADYHSYTQKTFFRAKGSLSDIFSKLILGCDSCPKARHWKYFQNFKFKYCSNMLYAKDG